MYPAENRPLEGLEALFHFFHEGLGELTTGSATRIEGLLSPKIQWNERSKFAVRSLVRSHPLLRSTISNTDPPLSALTPLKEESMWPSLRIEHELLEKEESQCVETVLDEEETGWQRALEGELCHSFVHGEPLLRFLLYVPSNDSPYLILVAHHGLFDGRSLAILAKEFVNCLRAPDGHAFVPPSMQPSSSLMKLIGDSFPKPNQEETSKQQQVPIQAQFPDANKTYLFDYTAALQEPSTVRYLYRKMPEETVQKLIDRCRRDGLRLTAAVIAAMSGPGLERHFRRPEVKDTIGFQCCVDLRRYCHAKHESESTAARWLGNLYSIADLKVPIPTHGSNPVYNNEVHSILQRAPVIQRELDEQLVDRRFLAGAHTAPAEALASIANELCDKVEIEGYHGRDFFSGVSNLGNLRLNEGADGTDGTCDSLGERTIRATEHWFMTRLARVGTFCFLGFSYIPGYGMCFVLTRPDPICSLETAQGILARTLDALHKYADG